MDLSIDKINEKPLFVFEMANNHMGDFQHGKLIVDEFDKVKNNFDEFNFSIKLQYRDDSFFHKDHINRKDHKLIKRFTETRLRENFKKLIDYISKKNFITMCTPWDAKAVDYQNSLGVEIIKIASCSFNDWDLLEKIATTDKYIIASTGGASKLEMDKVYSFLKNKNKNFSFMYCVGEYPTPDENLHLDQIDFMKKSYPDIKIGYSTHESPDDFDNIQIAIAKGSEIFEKHVGVKTKKYDLNAYSADPNQIKKWLEAARKTYKVCGGLKNKRKKFSDKEIADLRILFRGAYAAEDLKKGQFIKKEYYLAMPNIEGQLVAKDLSKFASFKCKKDIKKDQPLMMNDLEKEYEIGNIMDKKFFIKDKIKEMINLSNIILPKNLKAEISHHYGIDNFFKKGAALFHIINKEYSKIIILMFPNQEYPSHFHEIKNETYFILHGDLEVDIEGKIHKLKQGDTLTISNNNVHSFKTKSGVIFEEIASTYIKGDSKYLDNEIKTDGRKTSFDLF